MTGDDVLVVKRVNESITFLFIKPQRLFICIVISAVDKLYLRTVFFRRLNLGYRSAVRQADKRFDAIAGRGKSNARAWFPAEQAITPRLFSSSLSCDIL